MDNTTKLKQDADIHDAPEHKIDIVKDLPEEKVVDLIENVDMDEA